VITISVVAYPEQLNISIADTGIGMSADQLNDLSTPFMQADISTTRKYGGTGLGMSLTEHLAKVLGIEIKVQSVKGKGTCIELVIPLIYETKEKHT